MVDDSSANRQSETLPCVRDMCLTLTEDPKFANFKTLKDDVLDTERTEMELPIDMKS